MKFLVAICILGTVIVPRTFSKTTDTPPDTTPTITSTTPRPTTTLSPEEECQQHNGSCDKCVSNARCLYCYTDNKCTLYPSSKILPSSGVCALDKARWGVCWLNFEALIISLSVIGGVIIITSICCVYCCCCRGGGKAKFEREDAKFESQKMERKAKQDERRADRQGRLDEIRRKYGLVKDENTPYQRFDS
jgi:hypothetical protein